MSLGGFHKVRLPDRENLGKGQPKATRGKRSFRGGMGPVVDLLVCYMYTLVKPDVTGSISGVSHKLRIV